MLIAHLLLFQFYGMTRVPGLMSTILLLFFFFPSFVFGVQYDIVDTVVGKGFYDFFAWQTMRDPSHGRVQYVNQVTSQNRNLTFASKDTFILRADNREVLRSSDKGRKSVSLRSKKTFTQHVAVFNVRHMPQGCGAWPAIWEVATGPNWPVGGEIDIVEGANDQSPNAATLHTTAGCSMPKSRKQSGSSVSLDCHSTHKNNRGCGVRFPSEKSYGPKFNKLGGGWFVIERTTKYIKIYFWSRGDPNVPFEVKTGASSINPNSWGTPSAFFPSTHCNIKKHFGKHHIVINLTLCGDWAGATYAGAGCPSTCVDFVNNNPGEFINAYFNFASIRIYK